MNTPVQPVSYIVTQSVTHLEASHLAPKYDSDVREDISQAFITTSRGKHKSGHAFDFLSTVPSRYTFTYALADLRDKLDDVLQYKDSPDDLEHHSILFWPSLADLHPWLGKGRREGELIAHFDILRAQFRLRPVSVEALTALRGALHLAATALTLTTDVVDQCLDILEDAGVDLRFPLSFSRPDED